MSVHYSSNQAFARRCLALLALATAVIVEGSHHAGTGGTTGHSGSDSSRFSRNLQLDRTSSRGTPPSFSYESLIQPSTSYAEAVAMAQQLGAALKSVSANVSRRWLVTVTTRPWSRSRGSGLQAKAY